MSKLNHIQVSGQNLSLKKGLTVGNIFLYITKQIIIFPLSEGNISSCLKENQQNETANISKTNELKDLLIRKES